MTHVFVSLGSNIEPERNLPEAARRLASRFRLLAVSPVYETAPVGRTDQPNFLNAAVLIETQLSPQALKEELREIEQVLGRVRTVDKYAPRSIDLDIVLFGEAERGDSPQRIVDPEIWQHPHLAVPLADLAPNLRHPQTGETLQEIARTLPQTELKLRGDVTLLDF